MVFGGDIGGKPMTIIMAMNLKSIKRYIKIEFEQNTVAIKPPLNKGPTVTFENF
jgi:hypothetical protein